MTKVKGTGTPEAIAEALQMHGGCGYAAVIPPPVPAKPAAKRIYVVRSPVGGDRLVRAGSHAQAVGHVVRGTYRAEVAGQDELVQLLAVGAKVEEAGADA